MDGKNSDGRTDGNFSDGRTPQQTDGRTKQKKTKNAKCVSNDRSRRDDSNGPRIVKIGAILAIFEHFKVFAILHKTKNMKIMKIGARK